MRVERVEVTAPKAWASTGVGARFRVCAEPLGDPTVDAALTGRATLAATSGAFNFQCYPSAAELRALAAALVAVAEEVEALP